MTQKDASTTRAIDVVVSLYVASDEGEDSQAFTERVSGAIQDAMLALGPREWSLSVRRIA